MHARVLGYFWKPCPNCGQMFGGHEEGGGTLWVTYARSGWICCPDCPGDYGDVPAAVREITTA